MAPLVSVVITAFNQARYLEQAVQSALAQTYSAIECLIVDDGSTDTTRPVAERLVQENSSPKSSPKASLTYHYQPNGGVAAARNLGVRLAAGEWIQFLDADDWIAPDKIQRQLHQAASYAATVGAADIVLYSDYQRVYQRADERVDERVDEEKMEQERVEPDSISIPAAAQICTVGQLDAQTLMARLLICPDRLASSPFPLLQQAMLLKRTLLVQTPFDQTLKACEDRMLALTLLVQEVPFVYVPMVAAFYRKHAANMTDNRSLMRDSYALYFKQVGDRYPQLRSLYQPSLQYLLDATLEECDRLHFEAFSQLAEFPVGLWGGKLRLPHPLALKLLYGLRQIIPSFLLYKRYRGPRSKRWLAVLSQFWLQLRRWLPLVQLPWRSPLPHDPTTPPR